MKQSVSRWRRSMAEAVGYGRYSYVALNGLDRKLERHLNIDGGFFIEAGANDGFKQSNTYYFEKIRRWRGVLVEPIPELFEQCRQRRRRSHVVQAALVGEKFTKPTISVSYADLMSVTAGAFRAESDAKQHLVEAMGVQNLVTSYNVDVPARTLTSILDELRVHCQIDLLSLDVEGFETSALRGLDFARYRPRYICIEVRYPEEIAELLTPHYEQIEVLHDAGSYKDVLFRLRSVA